MTIFACILQATVKKKTPSDSSDPSLMIKITSNTQQLPSKKKLPVSKWKLAPSIISCHWAMTDYFNCVIVDISGWSAVIGKDTGNNADVSVWKGLGGWKCHGGLILFLPWRLPAVEIHNPTAVLTGFDRRGLGRLRRTAGRENRGNQKGIERRGERRWLLSITKDKVQIEGAYVWLTELYFWSAREEMRWDKYVFLCVCS